MGKYMRIGKKVFGSNGVTVQEMERILGRDHIKTLDRASLQEVMNLRTGAWQANMLDEYRAYNKYLQMRGENSNGNGDSPFYEYSKAEQKLQTRAVEMMDKLKSDYPSIEEDASKYWIMIQARGKSDQVRTSKPDDGRGAYVWRWIRFHIGDDNHMPVTDDFALRDDLEEEVYGRPSMEMLRMGYKEREAFQAPLKDKFYATLEAEKKYLDKVIDYILWQKFPMKQFQGVAAWHHAGLV